MGANTIQKAFFYTMSIITVMTLTAGVVNSLNEPGFNEAAPEVLTKSIEISNEESSFAEEITEEFKGSDYISFDLRNTNLDVGECAKVTEDALESFSEFLDGFESVTIHDDYSLRRGLSNGPEIYMQCLDDSEEFLNVLIHELGHTVDLVYMDGNSAQGRSAFMDFNDPVMHNDPSVRYYNISWVDETTMKEGMDKSDFVSGYAMTDPFEDFAETFAMYVQFGEVFRFMIEDGGSKTLRNKYFFMKYSVFDGREFGLDKKVSIDAALLFKGGSSDLFDVTKLHNLV